MGTLRGCVRKFGKALDPNDVDVIRQRVAEPDYQSQASPALAATSDYLAELIDERQALVDQILSSDTAFRRHSMLSLMDVSDSAEQIRVQGDFTEPQGQLTLDEILTRAEQDHENLLVAIEQMARQQGIEPSRRTETLDNGAVVTHINLGPLGEYVTPGIKSKDRARQKVERNPLLGTKALTDPVRGGFFIETPSDADQIIQLFDGLNQFDILDRGWHRYMGGYVDRKALLRFEDNVLGELQFWHRDLYDAKETAGHPLYETAQELEQMAVASLFVDQGYVDVVGKMEGLYGGVLSNLPPEWSSVGMPSGMGSTSSNLSLSGSSSGAILKKSSSLTSQAELSNQAALTGVQEPSAPTRAQALDPSTMAGADPSQLRNSIDDTSVVEESIPQQEDVFLDSPPMLDPADVPTGSFTQIVKNVEISEVNVGTTQVNSPGDLLHIVAPFRKSPQEVMLSVVMDQNNNVLEVQQHAIGGPASTPVGRTLLMGAVLDVEGVRKVAFAHNHPSGNELQSSSDMNLQAALEQLGEAAGIQVMGMMVTTQDGKGSWWSEGGFSDATGNLVSMPRVGQRGSGVPVEITKLPRKKRVPLTVRAFRKKTAPDSGQLDTPYAVYEYIRDRQPGLLMLDSQHNVVGHFPMTPEEMRTLRPPSRGAESLLRAFHQTNTVAAIVDATPMSQGPHRTQGMIGQTDEAIPSIEDQALSVTNVGNFLRSLDIKYLDAFYATEDAWYGDDQPGVFKYQSAKALFDRPAGRQYRMTSLNKTFNSLGAKETTGYTKEQAQAVVDELKPVWTKTLIPVEVMSSKDLPPMMAKGMPKGFAIGNRVFLVHDHLADDHDAMVTFAHELKGHVGVNGVLGEDWSDVLLGYQEMKQSGGNEFQSIYDELVRRYRDETRMGDELLLSPEEEVKEFIAIAAERRVKKGAVGKFMAKLRELMTKALRAMGFTRPFSMADVDIILSRSEGWLERPGSVRFNDFLPPALQTHLRSYREAPHVEASKSDQYEVRGDMVPMSEEDVARAVAANEQARRTRTVELNDGDLIGVRLSLNMLKNSGIPAQAIHQGNNTGLHQQNIGFYNGPIVGYRGTVTLKDAYFNVDQGKRDAVASGVRARGPMASIDGQFVDTADHSFDGIEIRFNPNDIHLFADMNNRPIRYADEVTIQGTRAFARGTIEYYTEDTAPGRMSDDVPSNIEFSRMVMEDIESLMAYAKGLPMDRESRMSRAALMNYPVEQRWYRGQTKDYDPATHPGTIFFSPEPPVADNFALRNLGKPDIASLELKKASGGWGFFDLTGEQVMSLPTFADYEQAQTYIAENFNNRRNADQPTVVPVLIDTRNVFDWRNPAHRDRVMEQLRLQQEINGGFLIGEAGRGTTAEQLMEQAVQQTGYWVTLENTSFQKAIRNAGFDGFFVQESFPSILGQAPETPMNIGMYNTGKVRSIFAAFDPDNEGKPGNILYSRPDLTPMQNQFMSKIGKPVKAPLRQRLRDAREFVGLKIRQGLYDQYRSMKDVLDNEDAYMMAHLSKSHSGAVEALIQFGQLFMEDGAIGVDTDTKGLQEIMAPLGENVDIWLGWIAAHRAAKLMKEGREHLWTKEQIEEGMKLDRGNEAAFEKARQEFEMLHLSVVDIAVNTGLISREEARSWYEDGFYLPFYRVMEDEAMPHGPRIAATSQLAKQTAYKKLKGGSQNVNNLLSNVLLNWDHLLHASLNNQAAIAAMDSAVEMGLATAIEKTESVGNKNALFVRVNGQEQWFEIDDSTEGNLVMEALLSLNWNGLNGGPMKAFRAFKRALTIGVTASPEFKVRNLIRDTINAVAVTGISPNIVQNLIQGYAGTAKDSKVFPQMMAGGGIFPDSGYIYGGDEEAVNRLMQKGVKRNTILDTRGAFKRVIDKYQDWGARGENINRAALFVQMMNDHKFNRLQMNFAARDLLDFTRTGAWPAIRGIAGMVPFLNARLQGLDKLGRAAMNPEQRGQFWTMIGTYSAMSIALYLMMRDDEDFIAAEEWERDAYHLFKLPGDETMYRIPRPFEVGAIASMAERVAEQMVDDEVHGELFKERLLHTLGETFSFNPVPQAFKPAMEVATNKNWFTQRNIESQSMQALSPERRKRAWTSETAIALSEGMGKVIPWDRVQLSPVQVEHLVRGYLGWLGTTGLAATDILVTRPLTDAPTIPSKKITEYPVVRAFARSGPAKNTKYTTMFYERLQQVNQAYADIRNARQLGERERAIELLEANRDLIGLRKAYNKTARNLSTINKLMTNVRLSRDKTRYPTPQAKEAELDRLQALKNSYTQIIAKRTAGKI